MSSTASHFCQCQCLWQIFWNMSALSFTSCSWTSSSKVWLCSFFLCTFPSVMDSCPPSSSQALPTSGLSDSCCAPCPTPDQCPHPPLMITSTSASLACLLHQLWWKEKSSGAVVKFWQADSKKRDFLRSSYQAQRHGYLHLTFCMDVPLMQLWQNGGISPGGTQLF